MRGPTPTPTTPAIAVAFAALLALGGCLAPDGGDDGDEPAPPAADPGLRFVALGDFGTGGPDQAKVAQAIAEVCAAQGCDLALGLGDLIYPSGASSPDDPQFDTKFERPYAGVDLPFWMALGNHDNGGAGPGDPASGLGASYAAGDNAVAYAQRTDRASGKWHMPARFYTFGAGPVDFIALDTTLMVYHGAAVPPDVEAAIRAQDEWLPGAVASSEGPWRIAFGHHPYVSNGRHGDAGSYDGQAAPGWRGDHVKEVFEEQLCGRVDLYLSGHDHNLQWLRPVPACGRTQFIVSGGGGAGVYELPGDGATSFQAASLGFWWIHVDGDHLRAVAHDEEGRVLYDSTIPKPLAP